MTMSKDYLVTKSNELICTSYDLSLQEQKIILTIASMVQPEDETFKEYEFKIKDFIKLLGLKDQSKYTELSKITLELKKKVFTIGEGTDLVQVSWLGGVRYKKKEGTLILSLDPNLKPYMLGLKEFYTSYKLENVLSLKSKYSIRLYEILKSNLFKNHVTIGLDELKTMVGANEKAYGVYQNVKKKVILQAQKELNNKTDINFDYEEIKTGRKVTSIKFYINGTKVKNKVLDEVCATSEGKSTIKEEKRSTELISKVKTIFKENITALEAKCILDASKGDINIIKEKYIQSQNVAKIASIVGWMLTALKDDYKAPKEKNKLGKFNDFEQRTYDLDKLEKKLLGWDEEERIKDTGEEFQQLTIRSKKK